MSKFLLHDGSIALNKHHPCATDILHEHIHARATTSQTGICVQDADGDLHIWGHGSHEGITFAFEGATILIQIDWNYCTGEVRSQANEAWLVCGVLPDCFEETFARQETAKATKFDFLLHSIGLERGM
jgi:hypothetical protein